MDMALSAARCRHAEQRRGCLQTLSYAAAIHGGQRLANDLSLCPCRCTFFHLSLNGGDDMFSALLVA